VPKIKDLSAQSLTITSKVGFQTMFFYTNFAAIQRTRLRAILFVFNTKSWLATHKNLKHGMAQDIF